MAVFALLAGAIAGFVVYLQPAEFQAKAVTFTRQLVPQGVPDYALSPVADDVVSTMTTTPVVSAASKASGVAPSTIQDGIGVTRIGSTGNVEVVFSTTSRTKATKVVEASSRESLKAVAKSDLRKAQDGVTQAQSAYDSAVTQLTAYQASHGGASNDNLSADIVRTQRAVTDARGREDDARTEVTAADSTPIVALRSLTRVSRLTDSLRAAVSATVIAAALGLMAVVALYRGRRHPKQR